MGVSSPRCAQRRSALLPTLPLLRFISEPHHRLSASSDQGCRPTPTCRPSATCGPNSPKSASGAPPQRTPNGSPPKPVPVPSPSKRLPLPRSCSQPPPQPSPSFKVDGLHPMRLFSPSAPPLLLSASS